MKRSEMVWDIQEYLYGKANYPEHKEMAEGLLRLIERAGMLPPMHFSKLPTSLGDYPNGYPSNTWEPEDGV